jgi:PKD repeat protein
MTTRYLTPVILLILILLVVGTVSADTTLQLWPTTNGRVQHTIANGSYAAVRGGAGTDNAYVADEYSAPALYTISTTSEPNFSYINRMIWAFNTASVPDNAVISNVSFMIGLCGGTSFGFGNTSFGLTGGTLISNTSLANGDYDGFGSTEFIDRFNYSTIKNNDYKIVYLNEAGRNYIDKTGFTVFYGRDSWDIDNSFTGTWATNNKTRLVLKTVNHATPAYRPYINITYTVPLTTYPMNPSYINETKILPNSDTNLPPTGFNISSNITPGDYELSGFVIKPGGASTDINITATVLTDVTNASNTIPTTATKIQTVKAWWQADDDNIVVPGDPGFYLTPELLLNNDSVVRVDLAAQTNEVWVKNATFEGYVHIDNTTIDNWQSDYTIYDNATTGGFPQSFSLTANENRQILLTTKVPTGTAAGNYTGKVWINSSSTTATAINYTVRVLPFTLQTSSLDYGIYKGSRTTVAATSYNLNCTSSVCPRPSSVYAAELEDIKNHGTEYPQISQYWSGTVDNDEDYKQALSLMNLSGLPTDKIFIANTLLSDSEYGLSSDPTDLNAIVNKQLKILNQTSYYGFTDEYIYGIDEVAIVDMPDEVTSLTWAKNNGTKIFIGTDYSDAALSNFGSLISVVVLGGTPNATQSGQWRTIGAKSYSYNNPQLGVENPEIYRQNYGFGLWVSDFDGAMDFNYQKEFGTNIWNEYDSSSTHYRDHVMAYPKSDGVIDTIQWEGYREGVDDSRYADYLTYVTGNRTEAETVINAGIAAGQDMSEIRNTLIDHILAYEGAVIPTASFTKNSTTGVQPATLQFNDTSTNTPTQWNWSFGDANWTNGTTQNVTHTYPSVGTYNVFLIASNAAGSNQSANQTVSIYPPVVANFTATADGATVTFSGTATGSPTAWSWGYNAHATPGWVQFSTAQNPVYTFPTGTYDINLTATNPGMSDDEIKSSYVVIGSGWEPAVPGGVKPVVGNVDTQIIIGMMIILILPLVLVAGFTILILNGKGRSVDPRLLIAAVFAIVLVVVVFWIVFAVNGNG